MEKIKTLTHIDLAEHDTKALAGNIRQVVAYQQKVLLQTNELAEQINIIIDSIRLTDSELNATQKIDSALRTLTENTDKEIQALRREIRGLNGE